MDVVLILGSLAVVGAVSSLWWALSGPRTPRATIDLGGAGRPSTTDMRVATLQLGVGERAIEPLLARIGTKVKRYTPSGRLEALEQRLLHAGTPQGWTVERVLAMKAGAAASGLLLGLLRSLSGPTGLAVVLAGLLAAGGFFLPDVLLLLRAERRKEEIQKSLSSTVDQIVIVVEAGLGLDAAIGRVARTSSGPLAEELARVVQDTRIGMPRTEALAAMADRVPLPELRHLVVALLQSERLGVPVVQTLRVQSKELRIKRRQNAEEEAGKMPVKILFPAVFCVFPSLFIVVLGPAVISIYDTLITS